MKLESIDVNESIEKARELLAKEKDISSPFKAIVEILLIIITLLMNRLNLNSKNSNKPPSNDPNRPKKNKKNTSGKPPGGQKGHVGTSLQPVDNPDEINVFTFTHKLLPF